MKHTYDAGDKKGAFERLRAFTANLVARRDDAALLARCYLTLGQWESELNSNNESSAQAGAETSVLGFFKAAIKYDDGWYKAWHAWALSNFEVISHYQKLGLPHKITPHLAPAVTGFFRSIALAPRGNSLQDTLRSVTRMTNMPSVKLTTFLAYRAGC